VKKTSEFHQHAEECRALAAGAQSSEHREMLMKMARAWESLAAEREQYLERHPESEQPEE
jgi:hypothetical protein